MLHSASCISVNAKTQSPTKKTIKPLYTNVYCERLNASRGGRGVTNRGRTREDQNIFSNRLLQIAEVKKKVQRHYTFNEIKFILAL